MYTDSKEYMALLYHIQDTNAPSLAVLAPSYEPFYEIDLETRMIHAPEILSVKSDHKSETVYFKVARWYDGVDLTTMCCIIQYINAANEGRVYAVPFYDVDTCSGEEKDTILFPWVIDGEATKAAGDVKFSVRFFKLDSSGQYLLYNLNTLPTTGKVEKGIEMKYEEIYRVADPAPTAATYKKGVYYILKKNKTYELCFDEFDPQTQYYVQVTLNNDKTDYAASFLEQMVAYAQMAAQQDVYWIVL